MTLHLLLLLIALFLFVCSTFGLTSKVNLQSAGLAFYVASLLV